MKRILLLILAGLISVSHAQWENYTGYGDTSTIENFYSDTTLYSRWFKASAYKDLRVEVLFDDTSEAGFIDDSVNFAWGLETAHPILNSNNGLDTAICRQLICLDTASRFDSAWTDTVIQIGTDGTFDNVLKRTDTLSVTGFATQGAQPDINFDALVRGWATGLAGNKTDSYVKLRFNFIWKEK